MCPLIFVVRRDRRHPYRSRHTMRWKYPVGVIKWLALSLFAIVALILLLDYLDMRTARSKLQIELERKYKGFKFVENESQLSYYRYFRRGYLEWTLLDFRVVFTHNGKKYMGHIEKSGSWSFEEFSQRSIDAYYDRYE